MPGISGSISPLCPDCYRGTQEFWISAAGVGTAVLVLDGLSLRELPLIVAAGQQRGLSPVRVEVRGSEVPTETDRFAEALGLPSRSKLYNNQAPGTFVFAGPDVYTDCSTPRLPIVSVPFPPAHGCLYGTSGPTSH